ncbi:MAG TPA: aminotransferase class V-fold PLP-dependent enzyme [Bellilinea sp.]|nr:aminotransferase class V-fold PLP-dependent enzyme [Bellilinea sp.]
MQKAIYLDYQASTPVDPRVVAEMLPLLQDGFGNPHSSDHIFGWRATEVVEQARQKIAATIRADSDEILFTSGATESNNLALFGALRKNIKSKNNKILVSAIEHKCVIESVNRLADEYGAIVRLIPVSCNGIVDVNFIESELKKEPRVSLVSVMGVNNEVGSIQPINEIGRLTRDYGAIFHCDAAQSLATLDIDVFYDNVDLLSISGHKIYGPQGIGALFVRRELQDRMEALIYGGGQQVGLRSGTVPVFLCTGLAAAVEILQKEKAAGECDVVACKRNRFVEGIVGGRFPVYLNGPPLKMRHQGNANLLFRGLSNHDIIAALQPTIAASTGSACTSGTLEPSYVLRAMGLTDEDASSSIRFSIGRFTTDEEIECAIGAIITVLNRLTADWR